MSNDLLTIIVEAFGPVGGICIAGLTFWGWSERKGRAESQEARISEAKSHAKELYETLATLREFKALLEARK